MRPVIVPIGLFIKDYLSAIDSRYKRPHASQCLYIFHTGGLMWRNEDANCWFAAARVYTNMTIPGNDLAERGEKYISAGRYDLPVGCWRSCGVALPRPPGHTRFSFGLSLLFLVYSRSRHRSALSTKP